MNTIRKTTATILTIAAISTTMFFTTGCWIFKYDPDYEHTFESPSGERSVTVRCDWVCRPDVYYNDECIFEYEGSGFMEDIQWEVEWVSEDEIILSAPPTDPKYSDEVYTIKLPD